MRLLLYAIFNCFLLNGCFSNINSGNVIVDDSNEQSLNELGEKSIRSNRNHGDSDFLVSSARSTAKEQLEKIGKKQYNLPGKSKLKGDANKSENCIEFCGTCQKPDTSLIYCHQEVESLDKLTAFPSQYLQDLVIRLKGKVDLSPVMHFKKLKTLSIEGDAQNLDVLADVKTLQILGLSNWETSICPAVETLGQVVELGLSAINVKQNSFECLPNMRQLKRLSFGNMNFFRLPNLAKLKHLRIFSADRVQLSDISFLKGIKSLKYLRVVESDIKHVDTLKTLLSLEAIQLDGNRLLKTFPALKGMKKLKVLSLRGTNINDLSFLKIPRSLEVLKLDYSPVANMPMLVEQNRIVYIGLECTEIDEKDFEKLSLPQIVHLNIRGTSIQNLNFLSQFPHLEQLSIHPLNDMDMWLSDMRKRNSNLKIDWKYNIRDINSHEDCSSMKYGFDTTKGGDWYY